MLLILLCAKESEMIGSIFPYLLKLSNKMLDGASRTIQDTYFLFFRDHKNSEKLFERMNTAIQRNIYMLQKHPAKFGMEKDKNKNIYKIDLFKEILLFMKSLCENHHEPLQVINYI